LYTYTPHKKRNGSPIETSNSKTTSSQICEHDRKSIGLAQPNNLQYTPELTTRMQKLRTNYVLLLWMEGRISKQLFHAVV